MTADKGARHYMVQVKNLILLGGCVEINASGEYKPGDKDDGASPSRAS
jgi:hypothetical protein